MLAERVKYYTVSRILVLLQRFPDADAKSRGEASRFPLEAGNIGCVGVQETSVAEVKIFSWTLVR